MVREQRLIDQHLDLCLHFMSGECHKRVRVAHIMPGEGHDCNRVAHVERIRAKQILPGEGHDYNRVAHVERNLAKRILTCFACGRCTRGSDKILNQWRLPCRKMINRRCFKSLKRNAVFNTHYGSHVAATVTVVGSRPYSDKF